MSTSGFSFEVDAAEDGNGAHVAVNGSDGQKRTYKIPGGDHPDYVQFFSDSGRVRPPPARYPRPKPAASTGAR
jgi:hypothetical protein